MSKTQIIWKKREYDWDQEGTIRYSLEPENKEEIGIDVWYFKPEMRAEAKANAEMIIEAARIDREHGSLEDLEKEIEVLREAVLETIATLHASNWNVGTKMQREAYEKLEDAYNFNSGGDED